MINLLEKEGLRIEAQRICMASYFQNNNFRKIFLSQAKGKAK